jgi:hypothetical protein
MGREQGCAGQSGHQPWAPVLGSLHPLCSPPRFPILLLPASAPCPALGCAEGSSSINRPQGQETAPTSPPLPTGGPLIALLSTWEAGNPARHQVRDTFPESDPRDPPQRLCWRGKMWPAGTGCSVSTHLPSGTHKWSRADLSTAAQADCSMVTSITQEPWGAWSLTEAHSIEAAGGPVSPVPRAAPLPWDPCGTKWLTLFWTVLFGPNITRGFSGRKGEGVVGCCQTSLFLL